MKCEYGDWVITQGHFYDSLFGTVTDVRYRFYMFPQYYVRFYTRSSRTDHVTSEWVSACRLVKDNPPNGNK